MKPVDKIAGAISQFEVKAPPRLDERVRRHVYEAFANPVPAPATEGRTRRWRLIVSNRVAQLAAAAVIVLALLVGLHVWDLLGTEAYALEQTVQALRKIETTHTFCTNWQGGKFEMWIRPDPASGTNDFVCLIEPEQDCTVISTPRVSYYYYPGHNLVRIVPGQLITSDLSPAQMIESLIEKAGHRGDSVTITRKATDRYGDVISVHYVGDAHEYEAWVDPETKLLLGLEFARTAVAGELVKSIEEIRYDEPVADWLVHFQCPDDAEIRPEGWGEIDDPKYGIHVEGLTDHQACARILTELFDAVNAADLGRVRKLIPVAGPLDDQALVAAVRQSLGNNWDDPAPGVARYEIGSPYQDKACPLGVLVPCMLTDHNGRRFEITLIVRFRQTEGHRTCVVVYAWGQAKALD
jgi:hypothetical protein